MIAALAAILCVAATGVVVPAYATAAAAGPPDPNPGRAVHNVKPTKYRFTTPKDDAKQSPRPTAVNWPKASSATLALDTAGARKAVPSRATASPVWASPISEKGRYNGPPTVNTRVLDQTMSRRADLTGVMLSVTPAGTTTGRVRIGLNYADFAEAYGGNYGSRLRLVQLPACAASTPERAACRTRTPVASTNDAAADAVSAEVTLTKAAVTVLAAVADAGSDGAAGGTYAATELKPSGSWTGGGNAGSFTYDYPITVPPAASDLVPSVGLSYDSGSVDGQTASTQAQSSWVGDGWSTPQSYIEQTFVSCKDDPQGEPAPKKTGDLCYAGPIVTMSLNGSTSALVWDATKETWKPESDSGEVITRKTNSGNGSGTHDADYWIVKTGDGASYEFGRNQLPGWTSGKETTNSVDTVPVYSAHPGDPCYNAAGFGSSVCTMASRWNLDYATDVRGNAMSYYYKQDTNYYGRNEAAVMDSYVRDSHLVRIDYGFRAGTAYGTVPNQVVFKTGDRCVEGTCQPLNDSTKANWKDVPYDLVCAKDATCLAWGPSFFSTVRLTTIVTQQFSVLTGRHEPVDTYTLTQTMPATGDATSPTLWLTAIARTGSDTTSTTTGAVLDPITLPTVSFTSIKLPNRTAPADGLPVFNRHRVASVTTETGSVIGATYELPNACTSTNGIDPAKNTKSCYPVRWTPEGYTEPFLDWFNKYAVTRVTATDPTGGAAATSTSYKYLDGEAWHYDDNEIVKAKHRTYGQFRGYATVQTFTGDGVNDRRTMTEGTFYRGMSKNNNSTPVNVTDSLGGVHEDLPELAGQTLEATTYQGEGGAIDNSAITAYWVSPATATRARTGLPALTAKTMQPALTLTRQRVTSTGTTTWRYLQTDSSYDDSITSPTFGQLKTVYTHTVPVDPAYDRCATNTFALPNKDKNLVGLVSQTETTSVACGGFTPHTPASVPSTLNKLTPPTTVSRPAQVVSQIRTFYDDTDWSPTFPQTEAPSTGNVTMTQTAKDHTGGAYVYQTTSKLTYDAYGRTHDAYDANGNKTQTAYTMNAVGLTTGMSVTNPLEQTTSMTLRPARGLTVSGTDINGIVTTQSYDALGRSTAVWLKNRPVTGPANYKFSYTVSKTGVTASMTERANDSNDYLPTVTLYDALLRVRQTQSATPQSGRLIVDNFYDTRGWVMASYNGWWDPATTPTVGAPVSAADLKRMVPSQTFTTYDGLGRAVITDYAKDGVNIERSTTVYSGDRTTAIPPEGGTISTTVADPLGRTTALKQYTTAPTVTKPADTFTGTFSVSGGNTLTSTYAFDGHGNQNSVADSKGNAWTSTHDLLGRVTTKTDPDAGQSKDFAYDGNGNLLQATDARGTVTSATYDPLGRKTATYAAPTSEQAATNQISALVYDNSDNAVANMTYAKGHLTSATAYTGGQPYKTQVKGFNLFGSSLGETITIPSTEGALAGDYVFSHTYTARNGLPLRDTFPAKGGLPAETVLHGYDSFDRPSTLTGLIGYAQGATQDAYGRTNYAAIGSGTNQATITNAYDEHTGRLTQQLISRTPTTPLKVDQQNYTYDKVGNLIQQTSTRPAAGAAIGETQCFDYDTLNRLEQAWTATDSCATTPTADSHGMVGNTIGAGSAYWTSWTFDDLGNRTEQIQHATSGGQDTTTKYVHDGNGGNQPHTLTATTTTGAVTASGSYSYDKSGNMIRRNTGDGDETLTWNATGSLSTVTTADGTSTSIYAADGSLLLQKDPGSTVLYLASQQHTLNTATQAVTGVRYHALPGGGSVIRTGAGTSYSFALTDSRGSPFLYLNNTAQSPTWRQATPYGEKRGGVGTFPDNRGFLNAPENNATGLTHLGAREYDPLLGRFISVDPLQDLNDPQQWNAYSYSGNDPIGHSDPTGLRPDDLFYGPVGAAIKEGSGDTSDDVEESDEDDGDKGDGKGSGKGTLKDDTVKPGELTVEEAAEFSFNTHYTNLDEFQRAYVWDQVFCFNLPGVCERLGEEAAQKWRDFWKDVTGIKDAQNCLQGVVSGCAWTAANVIPFSKLKKVGEIAEIVIDAGRYCSFTPDTLVLMADGTLHPIGDLQAGDEVLATDPETGESTAKPVEQLHDNLDTDMANVIVTDDEGRSSTINTTANHPFWDATAHQWQLAGQLRAGHELRTANTTRARVVAVIEFPAARHMFNLTVTDIHTYYVLAGKTPVLVHNTCPTGVARFEVDSNGIVTDLANPKNTRVGVPTLQGGTLQQVGGRIWGNGDPTKLVGTRGTAQLRELASKGDAEKLQDFYYSAAAAGRGGTTAPARVTLTQEIIDAWGG